MHSTHDGQPRRAGDTAVVLGASMAGLCAARALSPRFGRVVVVDRDDLPGEARWRGQVPQGRHPHLLLVTGARLLEQWFAGLGEELAGHGAVDIDICADAYWHQAGGAARRPSSTMRGPAMSRPLLEWTVRRRVQALPNVTIRSATTASGIDLDPAGETVTAVRLADGSTIEGDLVVDATGRSARSLGWLEAHGFPPPSTSVVEVDTRYVSRVYRRTTEPARDWQVALVVGEPASRRLAIALPMEGDRWIVMLGGLNGEQPPTDDEAAQAFAHSFDSPVIAQLMTDCEPLGEAVTHRFRTNQRRHVDKLRRFPAGWIMIGDAVCSFNPIYGQGMASAAAQAEALGRCLDRSRALDRTFARRYFRAAARTVAAPWSIAVGGDFAYPGTTGKKPFGTDLSNRFFDRAMVAARYDDRVVIRLNEVQCLLRGPQALLAPAFMLRVWRAARRGHNRSRSLVSAARQA